MIYGRIWRTGTSTVSVRMGATGMTVPGMTDDEMHACSVVITSTGTCTVYSSTLYVCTPVHANSYVRCPVLGGSGKAPLPGIENYVEST